MSPKVNQMSVEDATKLRQLVAIAGLLGITLPEAGLAEVPVQESASAKPKKGAKKSAASAKPKPHRGTYADGSETLTHASRRLAKELYGKPRNELTQAQRESVDAAARKSLGWKPKAASKPKTASPKGKKQTEEKPDVAIVVDGEAVQMGVKAFPYPLKAQAVRMANLRGTTMWYRTKAMAKPEAVRPKAKA